MNNHLLEDFIQYRINELVALADVTGYEIAMLCDLPINSVYRCLRGDSKPSYAMQQGICLLLGMTMSQFFEPFDKQKQETLEPAPDFIAYQKLNKKQKKLFMLQKVRCRLQNAK